MVDRRDQPDRPVPQTSNRSAPQAEITAVNSIGTSFSKITRRRQCCQSETRKKPGRNGRAFLFSGGGS